MRERVKTTPHHNHIAEQKSKERKDILFTLKKILKHTKRRSECRNDNSQRESLHDFFLLEIKLVGFYKFVEFHAFVKSTFHNKKKYVFCISLCHTSRMLCKVDFWCSIFFHIIASHPHTSTTPVKAPDRDFSRLLNTFHCESWIDKKHFPIFFFARSVQKPSAARVLAE